jgi:hypothetical protein
MTTTYGVLVGVCIGVSGVLDTGVLGMIGNMHNYLVYFCAVGLVSLEVVV